MVLIKWKYTEKYINQDCKFIEKDNYHQNYIDLLRQLNCPINYPENIKGLFFEPYYQLMRQTLLGWKMVETGEYNCDEYICLYITNEISEKAFIDYIKKGIGKNKRYGA